MKVIRLSFWLLALSVATVCSCSGPPPGRSHRYRFTVYALDSHLDLKAGVSKKQLLGAMQGHVLAQGELGGRYALALKG